MSPRDAIAKAMTHLDPDQKNGRRLMRDQLEARWKRLRQAWKRRDGTTAKACEKAPSPLGRHEFEPVYVAAMDADDARLLRQLRNARKRARKAGKSPPTWRSYGV
jgi:hypothetical protein